MKEIIKKVENTNEDFFNFCKKLDDVHNEVVAEQRAPNANCLTQLEVYTNVYIMYVDDKLVGCLAFTDVQNGVVEVGRVYVCEQYRKHGFATKLIENAEKIAKAKGATTLILDTYERLSNAISLYNKLGFNIVPQFPKLENSPFSICMAKEL